MKLLKDEIKEKNNKLKMLSEQIEELMKNIKWADARRRDQNPRPKERLPTAAERHEAGGADEAKSSPHWERKHSIV